MLKLIKNQKLNNVVFVREIEPFIRKNGYKRRRAVFICNYCDEEFEARIEKVSSKRFQSCGCAKSELISKAHTIHGMTKTPLYFVWHNMKVRCYNKNNYHYEWYGARGISICNEWRSNFQPFYDWAISAGWKKGLTIDRINNDGNYEPDNCRFVTQKENVNNSRELTKANTSGYRNIIIINNRYRVVINQKHIGMYGSLSEAVEARDIHRNKVKEFN